MRDILISDEFKAAKVQPGEGVAVDPARADSVPLYGDKVLYMPFYYFSIPEIQAFRAHSKDGSFRLLLLQRLTTYAINLGIKDTSVLAGDEWFPKVKRDIDEFDFTQELLKEILKTAKELNLTEIVYDDNGDGLLKLCYDIQEETVFHKRDDNKQTEERKVRHGK